ncbi:hypothetical protein RB614_16585 [Phytohabitans sp. ZYX-F-186]|uniref:DUF222 domain-containing protein n=1 Tax=Phytohabitans maris TaxID=3071409 RepID=A0ABU0ZGH7_9ACTN|nr:hypothetical protein [Phytohabitans sp. ZYX-F-186]MDQ7906130.1 hypothetical protein [Phytohabitans sp. ZYX-F-186]
MSLVQELGAQVRATSDDLPVGLVAVAVDKLRAAGELLMWVRQESVDPLGVPRLAGAMEHAEQAAQALRVAQDALLAYLTSIGLAHDGAAGPDGTWRTALEEPEGGRPAHPAPGAAPPPLGRWWAERVAELTGHGSPAPRADSAATEGPDLLRRVAAGVRAEDRDRLHRELGGVEPPVGLGLSALTPTVLYRLASDLLRHLPRAEDLPALTKAVEPRVRQLLPGLPPEILDIQLRRICRVPVERRDGDEPPPHPADFAVTGSVVTGILLRLLDREPDSLDPAAPEPVPDAETHA